MIKQNTYNKLEYIEKKFEDLNGKLDESIVKSWYMIRQSHEHMFNLNAIIISVVIALCICFITYILGLIAIPLTVIFVFIFIALPVFITLKLLKSCFDSVIDDRLFEMRILVQNPILYERLQKESRKEENIRCL